MRYVIVTHNTEEAISVDDAKTFALRVVSSQDDARIEQLIIAAREAFEDFTGRILLETTLDVYLDSFPAGKIDLPPPLVSVTSVKYKDSNNVLQTLAPTAYVVDAVSEPGAVSPAYGESWPSTYPEPNAVVIRCVSGSASAAEVRKRVIDGMYLYVSENYDGQDRHDAYEALWWPYRILSI